MDTSRLRYPVPHRQHSLITIDPGKRVCGVAVWEVADGVGTLKWCGLVKQKDGDPKKLAKKIVKLKAARPPSLYYSENPHFYPKDRGPHDDLKSLKMVLKALEFEGARPMVRVRPVQWKGNLPKPIHHDRLRKFLTSKETKLIPQDHNAWDAVGLGLFALGRCRRGAA